MIRSHGLFFAIRPNAAAAQRAIAETRRVRAKHGLSGNAVAAELLHVTLHWLGHHEQRLPDDLLAAAMIAGGSVDAAPFEVAFDRLESLGGESDLLVLTGGKRLAALRRFQRTLAAAMTDAGIGSHARRDFRPHVSLLFADRPVAPEAIEPIRWVVDELVLVDSWVGEAKHEVFGRWPLQSRQLGFDDW